MSRAGIAVVAAFLIAGCRSSTSPTDPFPGPPQASERKLTASPQTTVADVPFRRILCFGDSITYGVTLEALSLPPGAQSDLALVEGYVPKLWRLLESKYGSGFELVNAGVPGEGTAEGLERLGQEISVHDPDLVLLLEGVIDANTSSPRFPAIRENLAEMMRLAQRNGKHVIIGTYVLLNPDGFRTDGSVNIPRLNDVIRQEAEKQQVLVADHEKAIDLSGQGPDGLHPNNLGYEAMANTWLAAIELLAESMSGT